MSTNSNTPNNSGAFWNVIYSEYVTTKRLLLKLTRRVTPSITILYRPLLNPFVGAIQMVPSIGWHGC